MMRANTHLSSHGEGPNPMHDKMRHDETSQHAKEQRGWQATPDTLHILSELEENGGYSSS